MTLAQLLEQYISLGIFLVAAALSTLSYLAWRRERSRQLRIVAVGYAMFASYGLLVFLEHPLLPYIPGGLLELVEHGSGLLILAGLVAFFVALARD